jgi:hypothetical protein
MAGTGHATRRGKCVVRGAMWALEAIGMGAMAAVGHA